MCPLCGNCIAEQNCILTAWAETEMPASTIAVFNEPGAFEAGLQRGCSVDLLVTEQGQFRAELISIVLPRLRLLRGKEWLSRIASVFV